MTERPRVFIASSTGGLRIARAIKSQLKQDAVVTLWSEGVFSIMNTPLQDLLTASRQFDFALFIFHPEDKLESKSSTQLTVRDNVLFELGLFMGSLGRERCVFVAPEDRSNVRFPSDLEGIYPATYDATNTNLDAAVGDACYRIVELMTRVGTTGEQDETVLYAYSARSDESDIKGVQGRIWKNGKHVEPTGLGQLIFPARGVIQVDRHNTGGRFELKLRPSGQSDPSIVRKQLAPQRRLRVRCEARSSDGNHTLVFVFKDEKRDQWLADRSFTVRPGDWTRIDLPFKIPADADALFRIDDQDLEKAPSSISIRDLLITERE
jgi:hypothetical protein